MKLLPIILILACLPASAQDLTQNIRGTVVDQELESPIIGAKVVAMGEKGDTLKTLTDMDGNFSFRQIRIGRYALEISMIGYESQLLKNLILNVGKEMVLTIQLQEEVLQAIVVKAIDDGEVSNEMATVSARSFSVEETSRFAGSFNDPARMAQSFAGVASNDDGTNEIVIRGNSPRGVLWRIEGIEVPNPNHFAEQGASGGAISMLNSNVMANSDFYTGTFPGEFGNALSGVFDIRLRKGNNEQREYAVGAGVLGLDATLEGPFKKGYGGSYLINYRYSTLKILNAMGLDIVGDALPVFQDLSYNISLPTKKLGNFTLFGVGGISQIDENYDDFKNNFRLYLGISGITHRVLLSKRTIWKSTLALTGTRNYYYEEEVDTNGQFYPDYRQNMVNWAARLSTGITSKLNAQHTIKAGVIGSYMGYDLFSKYVDEDDNWTEYELLNADGKTSLLQAYSSWKWRLTENLSLSTGLHGTYFVLNGNYTVEPRAGLKWQFKPTQSLNLGFGVHSRMEDLSLYMAQNTASDGSMVTPNKYVDFTKAAHYVIGYDVLLAENLRAKVETYYQHLWDVPIIDEPTSYLSALNFNSGYTPDTIVNKGTGDNVGVELTVERSFANSYFFMLTGSVFNSTYIAGDGKRRSTRYNGNYAANLSFGKEFYLGKNGKNNVLQFGFRGNWAGGRRLIPILLDESIAAGYEVLDETRVYEQKAKDYLRLDFQCSYKTNKKKTTRVVKIDIQNVTNRLNMWDYYYDDNTMSIRESTQMGFVPVISYQLIF